MTTDRDDPTERCFRCKHCGEAVEWTQAMSRRPLLLAMKWGAVLLVDGIVAYGRLLHMCPVHCPPKEI